MTDEARGAGDEPSRSAPQIEQDIARSRAALGRTLEALGDRLTARYLVERGFDMISESIHGGRESKLALGGVRADPIPLALIGFGLAWMLARSTGADAEERPARAGRGRFVEITRIARLRNAAGERDAARPAGVVVHAAIDADGAERAPGWIHQAAGAAKGALRSARDSGGAALERAGAYTGLPAGRARDVAGSAGEAASRLGDDLAESFARHPLLFGAAGLLAGAALARLLPSTKTEAACLGEARERVWTRLDKIGRDTAERIRHSVERSAAS